MEYNKVRRFLFIFADKNLTKKTGKLVCRYSDICISGI